MKFFKKKKKIFGGGIDPHCEYCRYNTAESEKDPVTCGHGGNGLCKKYEYDPLKREPKGLPKLKTYTKDDFSL